MEQFRVHPVVGIARVGNSVDYVIAPETMAGAGLGGSTPSGGLPIRAGTENDVVTSADVRDAAGALKRQAARFRVFVYPDDDNTTWPRGDGVEVVIGSKVGARTVTDILWTVHLANKKANCFVLTETGRQGIASYGDGHLPPMRNVSLEQANAPQPPVARRIGLMNDPKRVFQLTIDPGRVSFQAPTRPPCGSTSQPWRSMSTPRASSSRCRSIRSRFPMIRSRRWTRRAGRSTRSANC